MSINYQEIGTGWHVIDSLGNEIEVLDDRKDIVRLIKLINGTESSKSKFPFNWSRAKAPNGRSWRDVIGPDFIRAYT